MATKRKSDYFDFTPDETDEAIIRLEEEKMLGKKKAKREVKVELLLDQDHMTARGGIVNSHLLCVPKGQEVHEMVKRVFCDHPFKPDLTRDAWNPISDKSLARQMPNHDIYWLCRSTMYPAEWVAGMIAAIYKLEKQDERKITNRVVVEF